MTAALERIRFQINAQLVWTHGFVTTGAFDAEGLPVRRTTSIVDTVSKEKLFSDPT